MTQHSASKPFLRFKGFNFLLKYMARFKKGDYFVVPNRSSLLDLDCYALAIYVWLCARADSNGVCFPSLSNLQETTGMARPTVVDRINLLEGKGFIRKTSGNSEKSNTYEILIIDKGGSVSDELASTPDELRVVSQVYSNNNHINNKHEQRDFSNEKPSFVSFDGEETDDLEIVETDEEGNPLTPKWGRKKTTPNKNKQSMEVINYFLAKCKKELDYVPKNKEGWDPHTKKMLRLYSKEDLFEQIDWWFRDKNTSEEFISSLTAAISGFQMNKKDQEDNKYKNGHK